MANILSRIFIAYTQNIYPRIKKRRGATRLHRLLQKLSQIGVEKIDEEPEPIHEKEWDNLLILDACRYDTYQKIAGDSDYRITVGSMSKEFIEKTFGNHDFSDTVLITANPYYHETHFRNATGKKAEDVFHEVFHTYQTDWDDEENTVMPEDVVKNVKTAEKLFPEKRKLVHFMQPHLPFIGSELSDFSFRKAITAEEERDKVWDKAMKGVITREEAVKGYEENLEYVLPHVEELKEELDGKTAVTADHGTFLGENGLYKHPRDSKAKALRKVPWHVIK